MPVASADTMAGTRKTSPAGGIGVLAPSLLRRLMILCPETRTPADTGFELMALPLAPSGSQWLIDCMECGRDHPWQAEDAFLE